MTDWLRKSYDEYIERYKNPPDLLYVGRDYFDKHLTQHIYHGNIKPNQRLKYDVYTIYGCLIVIINSHKILYQFFEYKDLHALRNTNVVADEFKILKHNYDNFNSSATGEEVPSVNCRVNILAIPKCIINHFKNANINYPLVSYINDGYHEMKKGII